MGQDVFVYARNENAVRIESILLGMRAREIPVEWHDRYPSKSVDTVAHWSAGYFLPAGETQPHVALSRATLKPATRDETLTSYADVLGERHREAMLKATTEFRFAPEQSPENLRERMLVNLVDIVAELGEGAILDIKTDRFYDLNEYRSLHPQLLGRVN